MPIRVLNEFEFAIDAVMRGVMRAKHDILDYGVEEQHRHFDEQIDPLGYLWEPLARPTIQRRAERQQFIRDLDTILIETGFLKDHVEGELHNDLIRIGLLDDIPPYGEVQQRGGTASVDGKTIHIPPRPFIGLNADNEHEIGLIAERAIQAAIDASPV